MSLFVTLYAGAFSCSLYQKIADILWEYSRDNNVWEPVTTDSMQYRLSKVDQEIILTSRLNKTDKVCHSTWPKLNPLGNPDNYSSPAYSLSVLWSKSVFCLGKKRSIFERFWNEQKWVYVNHHSPLFTVAALTAFGGKVFASADDGNVFERRRVGDKLKWVDAHLPDSLKIASAPRVDPYGNLWFVSKSGHLLQCERRSSSEIEVCACL